MTQQNNPLPCKHCGHYPALFVTGIDAPYYACINPYCDPKNDEKALQKWNEAQKNDTAK